VGSRPGAVIEEADRFIGEHLPAAVVSASEPLAVSRWALPGVPGRDGEPIPFEQAMQEARFEPISPGEPWGRAWGTTWFRVDGTAPRRWADLPGRIELSLDLGFSGAKPGFQCEGLVRDTVGRALKGLAPRNRHVPLPCSPGERFTLYVEAASNPDLTGGNDFGGEAPFAPTRMGDPETSGDIPLYTLGRFEARLVDEGVERLLHEMVVLRGLAAELADSDPRRAGILVALRQALAELDPNDPSSGAGRASRALVPALSFPAASSAHRIVAVGHAHIDSAWLWPVRESVRKVLRTFANVLELMDSDPDLVFVCSSAQHFAWVRDNDPRMFERVRQRVAEGRVIPVGNMWVESDSNMPSGESLARQFLYGTLFFESEFGRRSEVGWLPDTFGYTGSLPQLMRLSGLRWFFTQKMCWNDTNTMPHHTFLWEGIDGTRIFTHFPPNNTYSGDMRPTELARSVREFRDHGSSTVSLMPFGYGDGGGGPTREMMRDARLQSDLEGSPRLRFGTPEGFFADAQSELTAPPVWSGEMYLEKHRGVLTSQARTKRGNRHAETLLVEAELWSATAAILAGFDYPYDELDELWRGTLLLQVHDILPGSAIHWVYREAEDFYSRAILRLEGIIRRAVEAMGAAAPAIFATGRAALNPAPFAVRGVPALGSGTPEPAVRVFALRREDGSIVLSSPALRVTVAPDGTLAGCLDVDSGRELVPEGVRGNDLEVVVDSPAGWDAWDLDDLRGARIPTTVVAAARLIEGEASRDATPQPVIVVGRAVGGTRVDQRIRLDPTGRALRIETHVDWRERRRLLRLAFPFDVHAQDAASDIQFGHVRRPLHRNTSWEEARSETCAHRWVHVGEPGFGVALVNDTAYGHDITRVEVGGRLMTTIRQSLLRAPMYPDPEADQGAHDFVTLIAPAATTDEAEYWGAVVAQPLRRVDRVLARTPLVEVLPVPASSWAGTTRGRTSVVISCVKLAADRSGDLIVRLFEARGARAEARLRFAADVAGVGECDLVETPLDEPTGSLAEAEPEDWRVRLHPFQVLTVRAWATRSPRAAASH